MKLQLFLIAVILCVAAQANPLFADYNVSGKFTYEDLELDIRGFTGRRPLKPIRFADVLVVDDGTEIVLGQGATDASGDFTILVQDNEVRDVSVLVVANSENTSGLNQAVMLLTRLGQNGTTPHAFEGGLFQGHNPNDDIAIGTAVARYRQGGEPFNVYDNMLDTADFLVANGAQRPGSNIKTIVNFNLEFEGSFGYYSSGAGPGGGVFIDQTLGYDDTVILHELGHYVEHNYGEFDDNTGGSHFVGDSAQDPRLSWGEGWPTFWGSNVRLSRGDLHPNVYVNTLGDSARGVLSFSYDLEARTGEGASSENAIQSALWDMVDGPDTPDFTPGVDDEDGFEMQRPFSETWIVTSVVMSFISEIVTFEDFYDAWNSTIVNPETQKLNELLFVNHGIQYRADSFEEDNSPNLSTSLTFIDVGSGGATHHTYFPAGDEDWFVFEALSSVKYKISTLNMRDGADTFLRLYDAADSLLAVNDNVGDPNPGTFETFELLRSSIEYQPAKNGPLFVQSTRTPANSISKYGNYDFNVVAIAVGPEAPNVQVSLTAIVAGVESNQTAERQVIISNSGTEETLKYEILERDRERNVVDFPWVDFSPKSGQLAPADSDTIVVSFDGSQGKIGQNVARLDIISNDPDRYDALVAVVLNVTEVTTVAETPQETLPASFALYQNYPNPFNPSTRIVFDLPDAVRVNLSVYDITGRLVTTLIDEQMAAGQHEVVWEPARELASGVYLARLESPGFSSVKEMLFLK